jgi:hypothetical protein
VLDAVPFRRSRYLIACCTIAGITVSAMILTGARRPFPTSTATPVPVHLLIFPKRPGTMSGVTMRITVDAGQAQSLSNLDDQMLLSLGDFEPGIHNYTLSGITGYQVDNAGVASRAPFPEGRCSGQFVVNQFQKYYLLMLVTQDGRTYQCQIQ